MFDPITLLLKLLSIALGIKSRPLDVDFRESIIQSGPSLSPPFLLCFISVEVPCSWPSLHQSSRFLCLCHSSPWLSFLILGLQLSPVILKSGCTLPHLGSLKEYQCLGSIQDQLISACLGDEAWPFYFGKFAQVILMCSQIWEPQFGVFFPLGNLSSSLGYGPFVNVASNAPSALMIPPPQLYWDIIWWITMCVWGVQPGDLSLILPSKPHHVDSQVSSVLDGSFLWAVATSVWFLSYYSAHSRCL